MQCTCCLIDNDDDDDVLPICLCVLELKCAELSRVPYRGPLNTDEEVLSLIAPKELLFSNGCSAVRSILKI